MELIEELATFSSDPLGFVLFSFPWGEPGELENAVGPHDWQAKVLTDLGIGLITIDEAIRIARTSGHGIGKSALVSWIILWSMATFEDTRGVVTANTELQLRTKTWVELGKWYRLFIGKELFAMTATALFSVDPEHSRTWRFDCVPWSEKNTEAFQGLHNAGKRLVVIFDEASGINDIIWEVIEGALTDLATQIIWIVFGNPTRNKGRFRECFPGGRFAHRWDCATIDSRSVPGTNKSLIAEWIEDYGEDSDFVRVRVRGVFPRIDAVSFIDFNLATEAVNREIEPQGYAPIILGVDVGRFGDDPSVIYPRQGRDAKKFQIELFYGMDTMMLAARVALTYRNLGAKVAMVDEGGVGGGVVDRLRQLNVHVMGVDFGSGADGFNDDMTKYANKRAEIWGAMRDWLRTGSIPENVRGNVTAAEGRPLTLVDELTGPTYGLTDKKEEIILESKKEMRRRQVPSPNIADALACTFAFPVYIPLPRGVMDEQKPMVSPDYNPFDKERMDYVFSHAR
jgi:hypothetical protein